MSLPLAKAHQPSELFARTKATLQHPYGHPHTYIEEKRVGIITLIYGNGSNGLDVIGGHTDIPHINRLVEHTLKEFD